MTVIVLTVYAPNNAAADGGRRRHGRERFGSVGGGDDGDGGQKWPGAPQKNNKK